MGTYIVRYINNFWKTFVFKGRRLARKQEVFKIHLPDQNHIFLFIPKISWLRGIKLGRNSNKREFNLSVIKDIKHRKKFNYSGISIKQTHHKVDTSIKWTVWWGRDCFTLWSIYLIENLYKTDTFFWHQRCLLYRDSTV